MESCSSLTDSLPLLFSLQELFVQTNYSFGLSPGASFWSRVYNLLNKLTIKFPVLTAACFLEIEPYWPLLMALWCTLLLKLSNYAHYCKSSYNPLLTNAKSAIHIRTTSTWFYSCYNELVSAAPGPTCPSRSARPRNCLNITLPSNNTKINSWRRSDIAVGRKVSRSEVQKGGCCVFCV